MSGDGASKSPARRIVKIVSLSLNVDDDANATELTTEVPARGREPLSPSGVSPSEPSRRSRSPVRSLEHRLAGQVIRPKTPPPSTHSDQVVVVSTVAASHRPTSSRSSDNIGVEPGRNLAFHVGSRDDAVKSPPPTTTTSSFTVDIQLEHNSTPREPARIKVQPRAVVAAAAVPAVTPLIIGDGVESPADLSPTTPPPSPSSSSSPSSSTTTPTTGDERARMRSSGPLSASELAMLAEIERHHTAPSLATGVWGKLEVQVEQGRNLKACDFNGLSDPYVRVTLGGTVFQTAVVWENLNPVWSKQLFVFDALDESPLLLHVWDKDKTTDDDYMGYVEIAAAHFSSHPSCCAWYPVLKKKDFAAKKKRKSRGDLLVRTTYIDYRLLFAGLLTPSLSVLRLLCLKVASDETTASLAYVARSGRRLFDLIRMVTAREVQATSDPNTLFRSTSMSTKLCTLFASLVGQHYLVDTLQPVMHDFCDDALEIEVDASRLSGDNIESRLQDGYTRMLEFVTMILSAIIRSAERAPLPFRAMAICLQHIIGDKWGLDSPYVNVAVSSYTILRFFNPAIVDPVKYGLLGPATAALSPKIMRRLVFASKILQSVANNGVPLKAPGMQVFNNFIEVSVQKLHAYFAAILRPLDAPVPYDEPRLDVNSAELLAHIDALCEWIHASGMSVLSAEVGQSADYNEHELRDLLTQVELKVLPTLAVQRASTPTATNQSSSSSSSSSSSDSHRRGWLRRSEKHNI